MPVWREISTNKDLPLYKKYPEIFPYGGTIAGFLLVLGFCFIISLGSIPKNAPAEVFINMAAIFFLVFSLSNFFIIFPAYLIYISILKETSLFRENRTFKLYKKIFYLCLVMVFLLGVAYALVNILLFLAYMLSISAILSLTWIFSNVDKKYYYVGIPLSFTNSIIAFYFLYFIRGYLFYLDIEKIYLISIIGIFLEGMLMHTAKKKGGNA